MRAPIRIDPELGPEKLCNVCGEWWPLDAEFWYFKVIPAGKPEKSGGKVYIRAVEVRHVYSRCRACWNERSRHQHRGGRGMRTDSRFVLDRLHHFSYDSLAGSSSGSSSIAVDARVSATTRGAGVVACIEVVAR